MYPQSLSESVSESYGSVLASDWLAALISAYNRSSIKALLWIQGCDARHLHVHQQVNAFDLVTCKFWRITPSESASEESPSESPSWLFVSSPVCFWTSPSISISSLIHLVNLRQSKVDFATYFLSTWRSVEPTERHLKRGNQMQSSEPTTSKVKVIIISHNKGNKKYFR